MREILDAMYADMSAVFTASFGASYNVQTVDHGVVPLDAIYRPDNIETIIGDNGATQRMKWPRLDFQRDQLILAGLTDPENDLADAQVSINGRISNITSVEDDGRVMVRCRVSRTSTPAP